jgi:transcription antitermination factor NusG
MTEMKRWYVAYTKLGHEKKVTEILGRKKVENYCPLNTITHLWSDQVVRACLFKSNIFIRVCESELERLYHTDGVINIVHRLGKPAVINDSEIDSIKQFLKQFSNVKLEKISMDLKQGTPLTVVPGNGDDQLQEQKQPARVILPAMGYILHSEEPAVIDDVTEQPARDKEEYSPPATIMHHAGEMMRLLRVKFFQQ